MKQTVQPEASHAEKTAEPTRSRPAFASGGHLAQLAGMVNGSPRVQALAQMKEDIQRSARVQSLQRLAAAQLSESVRSPIAPGEATQLKIGIAGTLAHSDRVAGKDNAMEEHGSSAAESSSSPCGCSSKQGVGVGADRQTRSKQERQPAQKKSNGEEQTAPVQLEEKPAPAPNRTGLPDRLKAGVENLAGISMDDVNVHYNSEKPVQLNALAYAQGSDIHVAPGQEKHLPHEAWHIVQQKEGRVRPTMQMKQGVPVNDDLELEKEADVMGAKALKSTAPFQTRHEPDGAAVESASHTISRRVQLEKSRAASFATMDSPPIQARFDIELLFQEPGKREMLFARGISIDDLEEIQELLEDTKTVNGYLQELEASMERWFKDPASEYKYTKALDMALFEQEKKWMVPQVEAQQSKTSKSSRNKVEADKGQEEQSKFLGRIKGAKPLKDVGAAVSHGEYAHRIQWYVISRSALDIGSISPALLKDIYSILGELGFLKQVDKYVAVAIKNIWSLWGAVVDVPASAAKAKPEKEGQEPLGSVGFSAPVDLTTHISKGGGGLQYSQLRLAVLNRRIKRYFEPQGPDSEKGRVDSELAAMFTSLQDNPAELPRYQHERVMKMLAEVPNYDKSSIQAEKATHGIGTFNYDQRNYIAFALSGIPLS